MSLVSFIGPRPNIFDLEGTSRRKRLEVRQPILTNEDLEKIRCIGHFEDRFDTKTLDITYPAEQGAGGMDGALDRLCERAEAAVHGGYNIIILSDRHGRAGPHSDPGAARDGGRAPSPDPQGPAHVGRPRGRDRRAARGASFLLPRRLRRGGDQPLSRLRDAARDEGRVPRGGRRRRDRQALHQVDRQGHAQGDVQDGHLDLPVLLRRADLRRGRPASPTSSTSTSSARRRRSRASAWTRSREETVRRHRDAFGDAPVYRTALDVGGEYAYRIRGEDHVWTPDTVATLQHAVRLNAQDRYRDYARLVNEQESAAHDHPRPVPHQARPRSAARARAARRGRAGGDDRAALRDRRHVLRLDLERGARDARHRDEPDRRQVEHRRRRRGVRRASRRCRTAAPSARPSSRSRRAASA